MLNRSHGSRDRTPLRPHRPGGRGRRAVLRSTRSDELLAEIRDHRAVLADREIARSARSPNGPPSTSSADEAAASTLTERGLDTGLPVAGPGAPLISDFAVMELSALLGRSLDSGRNYVGQILELAYRLPKTWGRVLDGEVPVWKALRIADSTRLLPADAAAFVDRQLAPFAARLHLGADRPARGDRAGPVRPRSRRGTPPGGPGAPARRPRHSTRSATTASPTAPPPRHRRRPRPRTSPRPPRQALRPARRRRLPRRPPRQGTG